MIREIIEIPPLIPPLMIPPLVPPLQRGAGGLGGISFNINSHN